MLETKNSSKNLSFETKKSQSKGWVTGIGAIALLLSGWAIAQIFPPKSNHVETRRDLMMSPQKSLPPFEGKPAVRHDTSLPVETVKIQPVKSYKTTTTYTGEVKASRTSELGFERSGKLIWIGVDRGDRVRQGQAIARLDTNNLETQRLQLVAQKERAVAVLEELQNGARQEDISAAKAQVKDLEEQLRLQEIKRDRREYLVREGASAREDFDELSYGSKALSERLAAAKSNLNELLAGTRKEQIAAQQAAVRELTAKIADLELTIAKSTMKSPFSGTIAARKLDEGVVIETGQAIVRLLEDIQPEVEIGIPLAIASELEIGSLQRVEIGKQTFSAKLISILPEVNVSTRTRTAVLRLDRSQSVSPQQIAHLEVNQKIATEGYWLPIAALSKGERGLWSCYVAIETNVGIANNLSSKPADTKIYRVQKQDLEVLYGEGDRVFVRGTLQPGDRVIVEGVQRIVVGQLVNLVSLRGAEETMNYE
jgi:multidrug efflux pump subunit AcrA (membrane-fusion protein)